MIYSLLDLLILLSIIGLFIYVRQSRKRIELSIVKQVTVLQDAKVGTGPFHLVISIGKCGGSTLGASLRTAFHPQIHHVHVISEAGMDLATKMWLNGDNPDIEGTLGHLRGAQTARLAIEERKACFGRPIGYYTSGVREPVALAVSGYFQGFDATLPLESFSLENAYKEILEGPIFSDSGIYTNGLNGWFDREIRDILGIDVFDHPFDHQRGFQVIDSQGVRLMVIRQENFDSLSSAFGALYRSPEQLFQTTDYNRTKDKAFHSTYVEALSHIRFAPEQLDAIYQSRYVRHFYTTEEIKQFKQRWAAKT